MAGMITEEGTLTKRSNRFFSVSFGLRLDCQGDPYLPLAQAAGSAAKR
jgi:hypothetical protein